ncbi:hypothetical protein ABE10_02880, partial [Bacillus toyonensis]|nr:hypothetical protein [Bacillus toyonensis]
QDAQDVSELQLTLPAEAVRDELSVEVPEREAVRLDLEVGVGALHVLERVDVGHQVPAHPVGVDELLHASGLVDALGEVDRDVVRPADRRIGDAQRAEDVVVEVALAEQQLVHLLQELARPRTLDDAVIVGARQGDGLPDAESVQRLLAGPLELGGILEGAGADDAALPLHQPRHGVDGADAARVGERDRGAGEVARRELVAAGTGDQVLVGGEVLVEGHRVGALDARHEQSAGPVGLGEVD